MWAGQPCTLDLAGGAPHPLEGFFLIHGGGSPVVDLLGRGVAPAGVDRLGALGPLGPHLNKGGVQGDADEF